MTKKLISRVTNAPEVNLPPGLKLEHLLRMFATIVTYETLAPFILNKPKINTHRRSIRLTKEQWDSLSRITKEAQQQTDQSTLSSTMWAICEWALTCDYGQSPPKETRVAAPES